GFSDLLRFMKRGWSAMAPCLDRPTPLMSQKLEHIRRGRSITRIRGSACRSSDPFMLNARRRGASYLVKVCCASRPVAEVGLGCGCGRRDRAVGDGAGEVECGQKGVVQEREPCAARRGQRKFRAEGSNRGECPGGDGSEGDHAEDYPGPPWPAPGQGVSAG